MIDAASMKVETLTEPRLSETAPDLDWAKLPLNPLRAFAHNISVVVDVVKPSRYAELCSSSPAIDKHHLVHLLRSKSYADLPPPYRMICTPGLAFTDIRIAVFEDEVGQVTLLKM